MRSSSGSLTERATRGDPAAFGALIREYDRDLRGVAWSVVRSSTATDDIMQSAYEKAFRSIGRFDGRSSVKTWLHSIIYRTALDHVRYEGRRRHESLEVVDLHAAAPDSTSGRAIGRAEVSDAMAGLNPEQRAALMLVTGLGYSYDEAAEITGESRGTIASRVSRARATIERWESP